MSTEEGTEEVRQASHPCAPQPPDGDNFTIAIQYTGLGSIQSAIRNSKSEIQLEPLLAFFASFVLETEFVQQIMRWDMVILRESPWYQAILEEGREQGLKEGLQQGLQRGLEQARRDDLQRMSEHRFGELPAEMKEALQPLGLEQLERLFDLALEAAILEEFCAHMPPAGPESDGDGSPSNAVGDQDI